MKFTKLFPFFSAVSLLLIHSSQAAQINNSRLRLDLGFENGNTAPELFVPIRWSEHFFSGVGFNSGTTQTSDTLEGFSDSRIATITDSTSYRLNILSYELNMDSSGWAVGMDFYNEKTDRLEFGFFQMPNPYTPNPSIAGEYESFENEVELDIVYPSISASYTILDSTFDARLTFELAPQFDLDLNQKISVRPLVSTTGIYSGSTSQDAAYRIGLESLFKPGELIHVGFDAGYEFISLKYDMPVLNNTLDGFEAATIDEDIITTRIAIRFVINKPYGDLKPVIGFKRENTKTTDNITNISTTEEKNIVVIGLENRF